MTDGQEVYFFSLQKEDLDLTPHHVEVEVVASMESHLGSFHQATLRWDYFALINDAARRRSERTKTGDDDGGADDAGANDEGGGATVVDGSSDAPAFSPSGKPCEEVPLRFNNAREYVETFKLLILEECAAIVKRGSDDERERASKVAGVVEVIRRGEFHAGKFALEEEDALEFHDNDLVLLTKVNTDLDDKNSGKSARATHALGIVEGRESKTTLLVKLFLPDSSGAARARNVNENGAAVKRAKLSDAEFSEGDKKRFRSVRNALTAVKGERWFLKNLANLSTVTREWLAIHAFPSLPYAQTILKATPSADGGAPTGANMWTMPDALKNEIEHTYNDSQVKAVQTALNRDPLVLIQGPPGTGKTRTILSLLSVLLHSVPSVTAHTSVDFESYAKMRDERVEMTAEEKSAAWRRASPWLSGASNPRDAPPMFVKNGSSHNNLASEPAQSRTPKSATTRLLGSDAYKRLKILVCAPSNSALDEIVLRILQSGLVNGAGETYSPKVVRVGLSVHHSVSEVSMETLLAQRLGELGEHADSVRKFEAALERDRLKYAILEEASIVCSTLSFSGSGMFARMLKPFDAVIVDEAAQAVEPSTLVPLVYGAKQVFLVGDPRQLPATILSSTAIENKYDMSMFKRFQLCGYPVHMLKTQYRMHPAIRDFPSKCFYDDELVDGPKMAALTARPWHRLSVFRPFVFFDIKGKEYSAAGHSWANDDEADFAVALISNLLKKFPELGVGEHVAVISPYKAQVKNIRQKIKERLGAERAKAIDVNTIDGFQGREKDVCIFSVVRASQHRKHKKSRGLGFVADERRVNVGLTRARASLFVLGCSESIRDDENWGVLVESAQRRKCALSVTKPYSAFFSKHTKDYDEGDLSDDEAMYDAREGGEQPALLMDTDDENYRDHSKGHVHTPSWTGAAEFIEKNELLSAQGGFFKDGVKDDFVVENTKKGDAVGGDGDNMLADVEDGDDAARDAYTENSPNEPKASKRRSARGAAK